MSKVSIREGVLKTEQAPISAAPKPDASRATGRRRPPLLASNPRPAAPDSRTEFERRYAAWLAARARLADPDRPDDDAESSRLGDEAEAAFKAFVVARATLPWMIWRKWEALDELLADPFRLGISLDGFALVVSAAIKADLIYLGLDDLPAAGSPA